ncbi:uncharacterized protein [Bemisia tabaci]|uniref:uncharacterized protein isoform X1 n=1 Tax=Bemisia tabaci TaxID=7038 RepID=UPI003B280809
MSSAEVDYGAGLDVQISEVPAPDSPGERGETHYDPTIPMIRISAPRDSITEDNVSLFKLSGVDFVSEGGFATGRTGWGARKPASADLPLLAEGPDKPATGPEEPNEHPENETGDGLQRGPPTAEKMEVNEIDTGRPIVRKHFRNFKINEKILGRISSDRSSRLAKEDVNQDIAPVSPPQPTNHLLFNGEGAGRFFRLTFTRDESNDVLRDVFTPNRFRHVNTYAPATTNVTSIHADTDVDMLPVPALLRNIPVEEYSTIGYPRTYQVRTGFSGIARLGNLKTLKTSSNLAMEPSVPGVSDACETSDTSCNTLDTDIQVEDEIKTVEPLSSVSSAYNEMTSSVQGVTSARGMDLEPAAIIVIGGMTSAGHSGSLVIDEQMPSEVSLGARATRNQKEEVCNSEFDGRKCSRKFGSRVNETWKNGRGAGGKDSTLSSCTDDESLTLDPSRKNSFVSIDLDSESFLRDSENVRSPVGETRNGPKGLLDSKKDPSRLLKMKRKIRNICERVKHNVIRKR